MSVATWDEFDADESDAAQVEWAHIHGDEDSVAFDAPAPALRAALCAVHAELAQDDAEDMLPAIWDIAAQAAPYLSVRTIAGLLHDLGGASWFQARWIASLAAPHVRRRASGE